MLTAEFAGKRVWAKDVERERACLCPGCRDPVILKRGRIVVAHFAHRPGSAACAFAAGETLAHMEAKFKFHAALAARGFTADVEVVFGEQRADVAVWSHGNPFAFEFQRSPIGLDEINRRAWSYAAQGIAQAWIPILKNGANLYQYPVRSFERYAHALHHGRLWLWDPAGKNFYRGHLTPFYCYVEPCSWSDEDGKECDAGGYFYQSKRWKVLTLAGPYSPARVGIKRVWRKAWIARRYDLPACWIAELVGDDE